MPNQARFSPLWLVLVGGCAADAVPLDVGSDERPVCGGRAPESAEPRVLSSDADRLSMNRCGHLAIEDEAGWTIVDPDLETSRTLPDSTVRVEFSPSGLRLAYLQAGDGRYAVRNLVDQTELERTREPAQRRGDFGFLTASDGADLDWYCHSGQLASLLGETMELEPDAGCPLKAASEGSTLVYPAGNHTSLAVADLQTRTTHPIRHIDYSRIGAEQDPGTSRSDALFLSRDGRVLGYQIAVDEPCGDTFCRMPKPQSRFVDLANNTLIATVGAFLPPPYQPTLDQTNDVYEARSNGHGLLLGHLGGTHWIDDTLVAHAIEGLTPVHLFSDRSEALMITGDWPRRSLVRYALNTHDRQALVEEATFGDVAISESENAVAVPYFAGKCVFYPDRENTCHAQIWELGIFVDTKRTQTLFATQPIGASWIGDDGRFIASGRIFMEPVPEVSEPFDGPTPQTCLFSADGSATRCWDRGVEQARRVGASSLAIVLRGAALSTRLELVDIGDGSSRVLMEDVKGIELFVDEAKRRLAWRTQTNDHGASHEVWAMRVD